MLSLMPTTYSHVSRPLDERKSPVKFTDRNRLRNLPDRLHRRFLPFYMRPVILFAFMGVSLTGQIIWVTAIVMIGRIDLRWSSVGFALGILLGYIHGKWTARMWARDYLHVLRRKIRFWRAKGGKGTTIYVTLALGVPIFLSVFIAPSFHVLAGLQSYIFGFIGGMNLGLYLWVRQLPK